MHNKYVCYAIAVLVIIIWSTTFVSTKVLLRTLSPEEIMLFRYLFAYAVLLIAYPKFHARGTLKEELLFAGAGIFGGTLYFLTENYALKYSMASNVGLLLATSPMLTAIVARCCTREPFSKQLVWGFLVAFAGVFLVVFNGRMVLNLHPVGDILAIAAALSWALYATLVKQIGDRYPGVFITRKIFFYSLLTMLPTVFAGDFRGDFSRLLEPQVFLNLLFLGVIASSLCFLVWSKIIWKIGPVAVNNFIYLMPLITMFASWLLLDEPITPIALLGGGVILAGVAISTRAVQESAIKGTRVETIE